MLTQENRIDRELFDKLKQAELERGREEHVATEIAARTVKEQRRREWRSKDEETRNSNATRASDAIVAVA